MGKCTAWIVFSIFWLGLPSLCAGDDRLSNLEDVSSPCKSTSRKCAVAGGNCYDINMPMPICDFLNGRLCPFRPCKCCIECENQSHAKCRKYYGGSCKKRCDIDEYTSSCRNGCKCCGCKTEGKCAAVGGKCQPTNHKCPSGTSVPSWCKGTRCTCCIPPADPCPDPQDKCHDHCGYCDQECQPDETPLLGLCEKENCYCCVREPCPDLNMQCNAAGGYCNHDCKSDELALPGLCKYDNCSCCVKVCDTIRSKMSTSATKLFTYS
ncbi:keratin-associated protein 10-4-like [Penaeus indicus]|uniref:keratin-associated protein 10-4-like n=1 Tax=Penaeus indicus TaxID=29960 RepID=UPI00300CF4E8